MKLILASQSPRRKELLGLFHIPFEIRVADIDETMDPNGAPFEEVARVSRCKALAIAREKEDVLVAADTIVVCQGKILGKPRSKQEALEMLQMLSGRDHQVMTGVTVLHGDAEAVFTEVTDLHFRELSLAEIQRYVDSGEPMDKAGAYGIQQKGNLFVEYIHGDYYNVVGFPISKICVTIKELFGINILY